MATGMPSRVCPSAIAFSPLPARYYAKDAAHHGRGLRVRGQRVQPLAIGSLGRVKVRANVDDHVAAGLVKASMTTGPTS